MRAPGDAVAWMRPLGLIIGRRKSPLQDTYLPLDDAMTVLYGLNGAGKSFVLDALRGGMSGILSERLRDSDVYVLAKLPDEEYIDWPTGLVRAFAPVTGDPEQAFDLDERLEDQIRVGWERRWQLGWHNAFDSKDELAREFAESGLFLVRPTGLEIPSWELAPAVVPDGSTPVSTAFQEMIEASNDEDVTVYAPVQELWRDRQQPPTAPTVLYSDAYAFTVRPAIDGAVAMWVDPITEDDADADQMTAEALQRRIEVEQATRGMNQLFEDFGIGYRRPESDASLETLVGQLQARANSLYATVLQDAPALELQLRPWEKWLTSPGVRWVARRGPSDEPVPLGWLSHAERRWASLAIRLALSGSAKPMLILDEPEAALHRTAESYMAAGLGSLATTAEASIVTSTHSPELLDSRGATRVLVRRRTSDLPGGLVPFTGAVLEAMEELGLHPSDLLRRTRGFLLVEGEHDLEVLKGWFERDAADLGVEILPLRGGSKLRTVLDSRFLFDYTDALLFPFLDDVDALKVQDLWMEAVQAAKTERLSDVIGTLNSELKKLPSKGVEYLNPFLTRALQMHRETRVLPLGVTLTDILDYLPVTEVVPGADSWEALRAELHNDKNGVQPSESEFKDWLRRRYKADLAPERLRAVAMSCPPPAEINDLLDQVRARVSHQHE